VPRRALALVPLAQLAIRTLPAPVNTGPEVLPVVLRWPIPPSVQAALVARGRLGEVRYRARLCAFNGRPAAVDYVQEQLDGCVYAGQRAIELEGTARGRAWTVLALVSAALAWIGWRLG